MVAYLLVFLNAVALIVTLVLAWRTRQFLSRAVTAPGRVTRITMKSKEFPGYGSDHPAETTRYFTPHVEFAREDGTLVEFESRTSAIETPQFKVGEVVTVVYERDDPGATAQIKDLGVWQRTALSGCVTVLLLLSTIAVFWDVGWSAFSAWLWKGVAAPRTLVWVDRQGREEAIPAPVRAYVLPRLSPDGTKIALDIRDQQNDIWVWDLTRTTLTRLTFDPGLDMAPVWTPDGQRIAFSSQQEGAGNLFWRAADGTGSVERLSESTNIQHPSSFSPDGAQLVFMDVASQIDLAVLALTGDRQTTPLVKTTFNEVNEEISPDGRWLAYQSYESGQFEIYVRPFPNVDAGRWRVSTGGGWTPLWARTGKELFYRRGPDGAVMRVAVEGGTTFRAETPTRLFQGPYFVGGANEFRTYDVSPDGERFLMIKEVTTRPSLILLQNWLEELKRLVPTK